MGEIETLRRRITESDCDSLGHMNVAGYFALASDGGFAIMSAFGLDEGQIVAGRRQSFAVVNSEAKFRAELRPGQEVHVRSCLVEIGNYSAKFRHRVYLGEAWAFETYFTCVLMNLVTRKATSIDDALRKDMEPFLIGQEET